MADKNVNIKVKGESDLKGFSDLNKEVRLSKDELIKVIQKYGEFSKETQTASQNLIKAQTDLRNAKQQVKEFGEQTKMSKFQLLEFGENLTVVTYGAIAALKSIKNLGTGFVDEANKLQSATLGLESMSKFKGIDPNVAVETVKSLDLVKNGLLNVGDASLSLKNLLASGFTLEQSIELIKRFGDSAAFGRQGSLEFGYAIVSATEGIKNQNSVLVDNAGVTKNLSMILKEAGYSEKDLQNVQSDLNVRTALYNGLLKETQGQLGDAEKLTKTFQGQQAKLNAQITQVKQNFGILIQQALMPLMKSLTDLSPQLQATVYGIGSVGSSLVGLLPIISQVKMAFPTLGTTAARVFASGGPIVAAIGITIWWVTELGNRISAEIQRAKELEAYNKRIREGTEAGIINKNAPSQQSIDAFKKQLEKTPEADITVEGQTIKLKDYIKSLEDAKNQSQQFGYWNEQFGNQFKKETENVKMQTEALKEITEQTNKYKKQLEEFKGPISDRTNLQTLYNESLKKQTDLEKELFPKKEKLQGPKNLPSEKDLVKSIIDIISLEIEAEKLAGSITLKYLEDKKKLITENWELAKKDYELAKANLQLGNSKEAIKSQEAFQKAVNHWKDWQGLFDDIANEKKRIEKEKEEFFKKAGVIEGWNQFESLPNLPDVKSKKEELADWFKQNENLPFFQKRNLEVKILEESLSALTSSFQEFFNVLKSGEGVGTAFKEMLKSILTTTINFVQGMLMAAIADAYIKSSMTLGLYLIKALPEIALATAGLETAKAMIGALYTGTDDWRGGLALVGDDRGRLTPYSELISLPEHSRVYNNEQTIKYFNNNTQKSDIYIYADTDLIGFTKKAMPAYNKHKAIIRVKN